MGIEDGNAGNGAPTLLRAVPAGAEARVAALYWEAFGRKLGPALDPPEAGRAFIAEHLHHDRGIVAVHGGEVVGGRATGSAGAA
ncbi:hypothetical protein ABTX81_02755 [Kitasatospora sp. NPDC097605]|uniref:hypothetical protein n=1 Tax=Kitasatospora sp. NPDC097605 TaxID=3157226 RepID=UPI0033305405